MNAEELDIKNAAWITKTILSHLNGDELEFLEDNAEIQHYRKNEIIFQQGKHIQGCYMIINGAVKQFKTDNEGRDHILRLAQQYEILGYRSILSEETACNTSAVIDDCTACFIPKDCLFHLIKTNGYFALNLLQIACREMEESHQFVSRLAQKPLKALLADLLITLKNRFGTDRNNTLNIILSREEYANIVGTVTESVIRLLAEFKSEKLIDINGKKITLLNEKALEKIASN